MSVTEPEPRLAVVSLDRPQGATVEILTPFMDPAEAEARLTLMRKDSPTPKLLGLAYCARCNASAEGCERCRPTP